MAHKQLSFGLGSNKLLACAVFSAPGSWTIATRQMIARWLRRKAYEIEQHGDQLNSTGPFTVRHYL